MDASDLPALPVNEIRDYERINAQLAQMLDSGQNHIRLTGVDGQRLLVNGLKGSWSAVVEIEGSAGPELAAQLDAPDLIVVVHGSAADGAGRNLRAGTLLVLGRSGDAAGYRQSGGTVVIAGSSGPRAGLELSAGTLILGSSTGRLLGDRQRGGLIVALAPGPVPHAAHGRIGGRLVAPGSPRFGGYDRPTPGDRDAYQAAIRTCSAWMPATLTASTWPAEPAG